MTPIREVPVEPASETTAEEIEAQVTELEAQRLAELGRRLWPLHSRRCRRHLQSKALRVKPEEAQRHLALCQCGWPALRLAQFRKAQEDAAAAAEASAAEAAQQEPAA